MSTSSFDERLCGVFSLRAAAPVLNEYLASVHIDAENPAFVLDWHEDNVVAFVAAANCLSVDQAPPWLQTPPPAMTKESFVADVISLLHREAGGRCGQFFLAPNDMRQYGRVLGTLVGLQNDPFLQAAMQMALPAVSNGKRFLAVTYHLTDQRVHRVQPNDLPPAHQSGIPMRRLFS